MSLNPPVITHLKELSNLLKEEKFPIISLDTSFVMKTLVDGLEYHKECVQFVEDLKTLQPIIIFSELLREELWCANLLMELRNIHKNISFKELMKKNPTIPRKFYSKTLNINNKFEQLLGNFTYWQAIPVDSSITKLALEFVNKYNLLGADAIHIATMFHNGVEPTKNIVAFDGHIENIKDITTWTVDGEKRYIKNHFKEFQSKRSLR